LAGCKKAEAELKGAIKCLYIGPNEHGGGDEQAQIVGDLITKKVDGIAVSPANAAAIAAALQGAKAANIPIITWDSDLLEKDKGLRATYIGTHNYDIGVNLAKLVMEAKPKGGTICIQSGGAAAANHNERMQGVRDTLAGKRSAEAPGEKLTGQNGWTEVDGCPQYTNDDFPLAMQMEQDLLNKDQKLDAFVATGGFGEFLVDAYKNSMGQFKDKIANGEIAVAVADTLPMQLDDLRAGLATGNRAAAFRYGLQGHVRAEGHEGRQGPAARSDLYRARHLHAEERRHLHRRREVAERTVVRDSSLRGVKRRSNPGDVGRSTTPGSPRRPL
jgi:ribose transport system substrate-binding protein